MSDDVDATRVGIFGPNFGGYYAPRAIGGETLCRLSAPLEILYFGNLTTVIGSGRGGNS